jgi:divalent metal cation (Fe/Co/Zn/Cd) transporter
VALWLLYLGYTHGKDALVPLLGQAPSQEMIQKIRNISKTMEGVDDVHEIIIHDYGSLYLISLHVEIPEKYGPAEIHEITEKCERKLRDVFGGEVICHSDPLLEKTKKIQAFEDEFKKILENDSRVLAYHDFRVVAESSHRFILLADIDVEEHIPETEFQKISQELNRIVKERMADIAYCSFYVTPKFAY